MGGRFGLFVSSYSISDLNNFNRIAPYYSWIASAVYNGAIQEAQSAFLKVIVEHDKVLILGGGSGDILTSLDALDRSIDIDYVDSSSEMIDLSKGKLSISSRLNVDYHTVPFQNFDSKKKYDVVLSPFFLDCFAVNELPMVIKKIRELMNSNGSLLLTDFQIYEHSIWQRLMSRSMHVFFRLFSNLESESLQNIEQEVKKNDFEVLERKTYFHKFIFSSHCKFISK